VSFLLLNLPTPLEICAEQWIHEVVIVWLKHPKGLTIAGPNSGAEKIESVFKVGASNPPFK
jgi:hypothetical protein